MGGKASRWATNHQVRQGAAIPGTLLPAYAARAALASPRDGRGGVADGPSIPSGAILPNSMVWWARQGSGNERLLQQ